VPSPVYPAEQAEANARLDGITVDDEERALIACRCPGEISHEDFLTAAEDLATQRAQR